MKYSDIWWNSYSNFVIIMNKNIWVTKFIKFVLLCTWKILYLRVFVFTEIYFDFVENWWRRSRIDETSVLGHRIDQEYTRRYITGKYVRSAVNFKGFKYSTSVSPSVKASSGEQLSPTVLWRAKIALLKIIRLWDLKIIFTLLHSTIHVLFGRHLLFVGILQFYFRPFARFVQ